MNSQETNSIEPIKDKPPIFNSWKQMYTFVLIMHAIIIILFYLFTKHYS